MSRTEPDSAPARRPAPPRERQFAGIPVSTGIAIGPLHAANEPALELPAARLATGPAAAELTRLDDAVAKSKRQVEKLRARLSVLPGGQSAGDRAADRCL